MGRRKKERVKTDGSGFGGSFGDLLAARGLAPATPAESPSSPTPTPAPADTVDLARAGKIVLRRTRKGRGGRWVTLVEGLDASPKALDTLARELRKALGAGAKVEGTHIVVQGDVGDRLAALLRARGARQLVVS